MVRIKPVGLTDGDAVAGPAGHHIRPRFRAQALWDNALLNSDAVVKVAPRAVGVFIIDRFPAVSEISGNPKTTSDLAVRIATKALRQARCSPRFCVKAPPSACTPSSGAIPTTTSIVGSAASRCANSRCGRCNEPPPRPGHLIDSPAASRLGTNRALLYSDERGTLEKFRPYGLPSESWVNWLRQTLSPADPVEPAVADDIDQWLVR